MRLDFIVVETPCNATAHFAASFSQAIERQGVKTRLLPVKESVPAIQADPPDFTCSFSDIHYNGMPIGELLRIPHISFLVDPAIYFLHQMRGDYSYITCVDEGDVEFVRRMGFERVLYLPHATDRAHLTSPDTDRPFEKVFFGSCIEFESDDPRVLEASERVLSTPCSILEALLELAIPDEELPRYHNEVDLYTRARHRIELLRDQDVHIWGSGPWEKYAPHATLHAPISFEETIAIMKQAQVVLNSSPRFKRGLHERITYGALCGAQTALTQEEVLAHHTWDHRARTLLDWLHSSSA